MDLATAFDLVDGILASEGATDWERGFAESVRRGMTRGRPTEAQAAKLAEIARRLGVPYGLTSNEEDLWK